jgi:uncharacterized UPF0146 family protein
MSPSEMDAGRDGEKRPTEGVRGWLELADFILNNYSGKVVEVGIGLRSEVASLCSPLHLLATDREARLLGKIRVEKDDIFSPAMEIYQGASLIFSIRPPLEMQQAMGDLAREVSCDVLIRPLEDEIADLPGFSRSLINSGWARFYLYRLKERRMR